MIYKMTQEEDMDKALDDLDKSLNIIMRYDSLLRSKQAKLHFWEFYNELQPNEEAALFSITSLNYQYPNE